jgi:hypothetical protein
VHLTDGDRIRNLLGRYCHLIDAGDFAGVGALMSRATLCTGDGTRLAHGADEVAGLYAGLVRVHDDGPGTQHVVANSVFDAPSDDGSVRVTSTFVVLQAIDGLPLQPIMTGTYVDTFAREEHDEWHFTERRFDVGRAGVLDHHLTVDLSGGAA